MARAECPSFWEVMLMDSKDNTNGTNRNMLFELIGISKSYKIRGSGNKVNVLKNISLSIEPHKIIASVAPLDTWDLSWI
jgi:hypothetical protein